MIHLRTNIAKRLSDTQKVIVGKHTPYEMTAELLKLSDEQWGRYAFVHDPLNRKFTDEEKDRYTAKAMACGRAEAKKIMERRPGISVREAAEQMGMKIRISDRPTGSGAVIFAQYTEPDKIEIFTDSVSRAEQMVRREHLGKRFELADFTDILMAHELFHAVEYQNKKTIFTQTEKIELWHKPFSNKSRILALSEMAAMAFAGELTGCGFMPYILDVLLIYDINSEAACALYEEILEAAGIRERKWEDADNNDRAG